MVQQVFRGLPVLFRHDENAGVAVRTDLNSQRSDGGTGMQKGLGASAEQLRDSGFLGNDKVPDGPTDEETGGSNSKTAELLDRSQVNLGWHTWSFLVNLFFSFSSFNS